jgi:pyruvate formate lyase activating enzyme
MPHSLASAKEFAGMGIRTCWETNGMMHPKLLDSALGIAVETGGCMKFDLKAFDEGLHRALTGASNTQILSNFQRAGSQYEGDRRGGPLVLASTLLIPGYVNVKAVRALAEFIAQINPEIPYSLLAFAPSFYLSDLPCTSSRHAEQAKRAAEAAGLVNVRIGNRQLLDLGW